MNEVKTMKDEWLAIVSMEEVKPYTKTLMYLSLIKVNDTAGGRTYHSEKVLFSRCELGELIETLVSECEEYPNLSFIFDSTSASSIISKYIRRCGFTVRNIDMLCEPSSAHDKALFTNNLAKAISLFHDAFKHNRFTYSYGPMSTISDAPLVRNDSGQWEPTSIAQRKFVEPFDCVKDMEIRNCYLAVLVE